MPRGLDDMMAFTILLISWSRTELPIVSHDETFITFCFGSKVIPVSLPQVIWAFFIFKISI